MWPEIVDILLHPRRWICAKLDVVALVDRAKGDPVELGVGHAESQANTRGAKLIIAQSEGLRIDVAGKNIERPGDTVGSEIRIGHIEVDCLLGPAGIERQADRFAGTQPVLLNDTCGQNDLVGTRKAEAEHEGTGRALDDIDVQIDLIGSIRHRDGIDGDIGEIAEPHQPLARQTNLVGVVPGALELAKLATDHFITALGVA